ncbi:hypothetical protein Srot_1183 [Segniliparus rotundus DSM 44985]|uniref:Uncharacterized protein n=1 Tax=Segniliparus rotundus (strain ATCC BAA-972 / CDC 1076 / CIP 108378 / DSM 44985 / JCM 13578) TaxID=640132 RepID=D6ZFD0_SEGRD|nr:hypothetical protein [Segniliparus rotundus]ADG97654.1 hypothetical protein Srot_1183 [Segniliparus rotundus DSM 44985]
MSAITPQDWAITARTARIARLQEELDALHKRHAPVWTDLRDGHWQWTAGDFVFSQLWRLLSDLNSFFLDLAHHPELAPGGGPPQLRLVEPREESEQ